MELRHLRYLQALAQEGTFLRAAQALHITQPSLSQQIHQLERLLGVRLVERGRGRQTHLTPEGEQLLRYGRRALVEIDAGLAALAAMQDVPQGRLRLGVLPTVAATWLPVVLADYLGKFPKVTVTVEEWGTGEILQRLEQEEADLGLVTLPVGPGFRAQPLMSEPLVVIAAPDQAVGAKRLAELAPWPFVLHSPGYHLREVILDSCQVAGFQPQVSFQSGRLETIVGLVLAGLGIALVPASTAPLCLARGAQVLQLDDAPRRTVGAVWRARHSQSLAEQAFVERCLCYDYGRNQASAARESTT